MHALQREFRSLIPDLFSWQCGTTQVAGRAVRKIACIEVEEAVKRHVGELVRVGCWLMNNNGHGNNCGAVTFHEFSEICHLSARAQNVIDEHDKLAGLR